MISFHSILPWRTETNPVFSNDKSEIIGRIEKAAAVALTSLMALTFITLGIACDSALLFVGGVVLGLMALHIATDCLSSGMNVIHVVTPTPVRTSRWWTTSWSPSLSFSSRPWRMPRFSPGPISNIVRPVVNSPVGRHAAGVRR